MVLITKTFLDTQNFRRLLVLKKDKKRKQITYQSIWRWHMYAGIIIAPFLLILAITGSVYLFKPQVEQFLYDDYYTVADQGEKLPHSEIVDTVKNEHPDSDITNYRPGEAADRSAEVKINEDGVSYTFFVNPYNAEIIGTLNDQHRIIDRVEEFHGELMLGTFGDLIVELAACWTLILIFSGLFLWWPRKMRMAGVLYPRLKSRKRIFIRDLHAVPGFWLSLAIVFLVFTGLLWTGNWGSTFQTLTTNAGVGYPPSIWVGSAPSSDVQTKDIADVPWAAETLEVPASNQKGYLPLSIDDVVAITDNEEIYPTYEVIYPQTEDGVYTISVFPQKAKEDAPMNIDQYSGEILADYRYDNYEPLGKLMAWGITVHKGLEYGLANQLIGLFVCLGIIGLIIGGVTLWWKRKPEGHFGAPKSISILKLRGILMILIVFAIVFPLFGLSVLVILLLDRFVIRRISKLRKWFYGSSEEGGEML